MEIPEETTLSLDEVVAKLSLRKAEVYRRVKDGVLKVAGSSKDPRFSESAVEELAEDMAGQKVSRREEVDAWLDRLEKTLTAEGLVPDQPDAEDESKRREELVRRLLAHGIASAQENGYLDPLHEGGRYLCRKSGLLEELGVLGKFVYTEVREGLLSRIPAPAEGATGPARALMPFTYGSLSSQIELVRIPTLLGDQIHIRFHGDGSFPSLESVGYGAEQAEDVRRLLTGRPGLILLVGPQDGVALRHRLALAGELLSAKRLVVSLERKIQQRSEQLVQLALPAAEEARAGVWEAVMEMGPDVVLLDEIVNARDFQDLRMVVASGAVAVAQLPASGWPEVLHRLDKLEIDRGLVLRDLIAAVERRTLRRICPACRRPADLAPEDRARFGLPEDCNLAEPTGCDLCGDGFQGRRASFGILAREAMGLDGALQGSARESAAAVLKQLLAEGEIHWTEARPLLDEWMAEAPQAADDQNDL